MPDRILVTVKTYPTLSQKYGETVCTAGLREDGSWVRIYPVPFRRLDAAEQYRKFDWIECDLRKSSKDRRPETRHPTEPEAIHRVGHIDTKDEWSERRDIVLRKATVHTNLATLINGAKENKMSLAVFKPARVLGFIVEKAERDWDPKKLEAMKAESSQLGLFDVKSWSKPFEVIPKLPYKFSYHFSDSEGKKSKLQILDWEIGALYWKCLRSVKGDEGKALDKVRAKYLDDFIQKDLHFFLGTTLQFHQVGTNPWVIVGVFPIPHERQLRMF